MAFGAEFSIPAAVRGIQPLRVMLGSKDQADRKTMDKILKDCVILSAVDPAAGLYLNGDQQ